MHSRRRADGLLALEETRGEKVIRSRVLHAEPPPMKRLRSRRPRETLLRDDDRCRIAAARASRLLVRASGTWTVGKNGGNGPQEYVGTKRLQQEVLFGLSQRNAG